MTPEQKAKELVDKFYNPAAKFDWIEKSGFQVNQKETIEAARQCALICVDEMIKIQEDFYGLVLTQPFRDRCIERVEYLERVKSLLSNGQNVQASVATKADSSNSDDKQN